MSKKKRKPECKKSSTGRHVWEKVEERRDLTIGGRWVPDWGTTPGDYCVYCEQRKRGKTFRYRPVK